MDNISPFHLAIPVQDLDATLSFYTEKLGCEKGRSSDKWVDLNFFGHQLVLHHTDTQKQDPSKNPVDGKKVPVPHFGIVLPWDKWNQLATNLVEKEIVFEIEPYTRFEGTPGEQGTFFFLDPSQNALEFKSFKNMSSLFTDELY